MRCSQRRGSVLQKSSSGLRQSFNGYGRKSARNMSPRFHAQVQNFRMIQSTDFPGPGGARSKIAVSTGNRSRELARPLPPPSGSWQNAPTSRLGLEKEGFRRNMNVELYEKYSKLQYVSSLESGDNTAARAGPTRSSAERTPSLRRPARRARRRGPRERCLFQRWLMSRIHATTELCLH